MLKFSALLISAGKAISFFFIFDFEMTFMILSQIEANIEMYFFYLKWIYETFLIGTQCLYVGARATVNMVGQLS